MTDHDETTDGPQKDQRGSGEGPEKTSIVARLKQLHEERPAVFAFGLMGFSVLALLLGTLLMGDINFPFTGTRP